MSYYEKLGVSKDAHPNEIKRAYRAKARKLHPDKGGDPAEFAEVASAYVVLSDPPRRLLYDTTGEGEQPPIESEVQGVLLAFFNEALSSDEDVEVLAFVRERIDAGVQRIAEGRKKVEARRRKLEAKRGKITSSGTVNIADLIIDGELHSIAGQILNLDRQEEVSKGCLAALESYSEDWEPPPAPPRMIFTAHGSYFKFEGLG